MVNEDEEGWKGNCEKVAVAEVVVEGEKQK